MRYFSRFVTLLSDMGVCVAACILLYSVSHILLETFLRSVFSISTHVLDEFIGFAIVSITFMTLGRAMKEGAMIRVNILSNILSERYRFLLESIISLVACLSFSFITFYFIKIFLKDFKRGAVSASVAEVPLWIPDLVIVTGAVILVLQLLDISISKLTLFFKK